MRGRHILLTGASGFLGAHVLRLLLAEGARVSALARDPGKIPQAAGLAAIKADLTTDFCVALNDVGDIDDVVHLAQSGGWKAFPVNAGDIAAVAVAATARLAEHAVKCGARTFVLASSGGIYGPSPDPIREDAPIRPAAELGFYLSAKAAAETLASFFAPQITMHRLRYFFIYGPGQRDEFLMARMLKSVREGTPIKLANGRGPRLNPVHVEDAARATVAALDAPAAVTANIAGPEVADLATIVRLMGELAGRAPVCQTVDGLSQDYVADTSTMTRLLGAPSTRLAQGLDSLRNS